MKGRRKGITFFSLRFVSVRLGFINMNISLSRDHVIVMSLCVYTGKEGLKTVLNDIVRTRKTIMLMELLVLVRKLSNGIFLKSLKHELKQE